MSVTTRVKFWKLLLIVILAGAFVLPPISLAQETKRKVKYRVVPTFPALARQMNITGKVRIQAVVSANGRVKSTHAIGGSPLLVNAAIQALKGWKFEPGPKETTEIVEFDFKQ